MSKSISESLDNINIILDTKCHDAGGELHFDPEHLGIFREETAYLGERLGLSPFQCVLLAVIIQLPEGRCSIRKVGSTLGMSYLKTLSYSEDFDKLREMGYIRIEPDNDIKVTSEAISALMNDSALEKPKVEGLTAKEIFRRISMSMRLLARNQMKEENVLEETDLLIRSNPEVPFSAACINLFKAPEIGRNERFLFYVLSYLHVCKGFMNFDSDDIQGYYTDDSTFYGIQSRMEDNGLELQAKGLVVPSSLNGFMAKGTYSFSDTAEKTFFRELSIPSVNVHMVDLKDMQNKPEKNLFYNPREAEQIERLSSLLDPKHLNEVFQAMTARGLRTGFTCLFFGSPGTGKTETVYQLARRTGRKILEADVAKLRNCYIGETEKNVRKLFVDYRLANEENELSPILLFNEADAILGKRMEGASRAADRMENSVQNILLQELEDFSGIFIATTNFTTNLDPAFDRRFLYKICFEKPALEPRAKIWKSQFPALSEEEALSIASAFDLSGGQIENVVRKNAVDSILTGKEGSYEDLLRYCREESLGNNNRNRIGF